MRGDVLYNSNQGYALAMGMVVHHGRLDRRLLRSCSGARSAGSREGDRPRLVPGGSRLSSSARCYFFVPLIADRCRLLARNPIGAGRSPHVVLATCGTVLGRLRTSDEQLSIGYSFVDRHPHHHRQHRSSSCRRPSGSACTSRARDPSSSSSRSCRSSSRRSSSSSACIQHVSARRRLPSPHSDMGSNVLLVAAYTVLSFPYMYRAVDSGLRAIDIQSLTEAVAEPGRGLDPDPVAGDPAEPAGVAAERRLPDPGHRRRRVHDRDLPRPAGLRRHTSPLSATSRPTSRRPSR